MTAALILLAIATLQSADWINEGGNARRTNWQPEEREITPASARNLKLIWKRQLGGGGHQLSTPIILGRLITYRGTVELVFVTSSKGFVYAVDGDFGKVFWTHQLPLNSNRCATVATPALTPLAPGFDPDDDGPQPLRPLYVLAPDAMLHTLNPIDGKDYSMPRPASCAASLVVRGTKSYAAGPAPNNAVWRDARGARHTYPGAVVAGGVAFVLQKSTGELQAFDALTRELLYRSGPTNPAAGSLAVANGHVCFTALDSTLYCFGFPGLVN